ncbi:MAG: hypothetical protein QXN35_06490 [Ignisphaera sp.]
MRKMEIDDMVREDEEQVLFEIPDKTRVVACRVTYEFPVFNPRHTHFDVTVYISLRIRKYRNRYLVAKKKTARREFTAPLGSIVKITYTTGSNKHVYYRYLQYFIVDNAEEKEYEVDVEGREEEKGKIKVKNLVPLSLDDFDKSEIEAEVMNTYNARLSEYDPAAELYHFWIKKRVADTIIQANSITTHDMDIEEQMKKLDELVKQKEQELQTLKEQLQQLQLKQQLEQMKKQLV